MFDFFKSAADNFGTSHILQLSFLVWMLVLLALTFDFLNGLHDAANSIATIVSTRVLSPWWAVAWAAFFNFAAFILFPLKVAATISSDVIDQSLVHNPDYANHLIAATLLAACAWNVFTWWLGLPTSSSHALIGGMIGAAVAITGSVSYIKADGLGWVVLALLIGPAVGLSLGGLYARWRGLPTAAPQAFVGAVVGLGVAAGTLALFAALGHVHVQGFAWIVLFIVLAPMIGYSLGSLITIIVLWTVYWTHGSPQRID